MRSHRKHLLDPDRLDICELANSVNAQFAAVPGTLHASEWHASVGSHHLVDEHHSRFKLVDEALLFGCVVRPGTRAHAERAAVRDSDRVVNILRAKYRRHRPE